MKEYPLVSVVIPAYNHQDYVETCLDSVLEDTYPNKEIVIINDGSKDDTERVIREWTEKNGSKIRVIFISRENRGLTASCNELIRESNGEYLAVLASDDFLLPGGIEKRYKYLSSNPRKLAVISDCIVVDNSGEKIYDSAFNDVAGVDKKLLGNDEDMKKYMIIFGFVPGPALMVKKSLYDEIGLYDESLAFEDWTFYLNTSAKNLLGFLDENLSAWRWHNDNTSRAGSSHGTVIKQHLALALGLLGKYRGMKYKFYLLQKIVFLFVYSTYLSVKTCLINGLNNEKSHIMRFLAGSLYKILILLKNIFAPIRKILLNLTEH